MKGGHNREEIREAEEDEEEEEEEEDKVSLQSSHSGGNRRPPPRRGGSVPHATCQAPEPQTLSRPTGHHPLYIQLRVSTFTLAQHVSPFI